MNIEVYEKVLLVKTVLCTILGIAVKWGGMSRQVTNVCLKVQVLTQMYF
jgi:hypothetical protein